MSSALPSERALNPTLTASISRDVVLLDVLPISSGDQLQVAFEAVNSPWRQGVWLGTDGILQVNGKDSSQVVLWSDTAPGRVEIEISETDGKLRLYNIWDSGRGIRDHESQSATSGMLVEQLGNRSYRYRCNDIGYDPAFDKLVFTISISER